MKYIVELTCEERALSPAAARVVASKPADQWPARIAASTANAPAVSGNRSFASRSALCLSFLSEKHLS